jgi:hypothetical protein
MADFLAFHARRHFALCEKAGNYLPLSDFQKVIFYSIPTAVCVLHQFLTDEEIENGSRDLKSWRQSTPWL